MSTQEMVVEVVKILAGTVSACGFMYLIYKLSI